ncbi:MAG: hypothetical protein ACYC67_26875 [Prosthecobacter sp.]
MMVFPKGFGKLNPMGRVAAFHGELAESAADKNENLDADDLGVGFLLNRREQQNRRVQGSLACGLSQERANADLGPAAVPTACSSD